MTVLLALVLGLPAVLVDFLAAQGDVSPPVTLAVLLGGAVLLGAFAPIRPWLGALALGLMLPVAHVIAHAAGYSDNVSPNTYAARLLMAPLTVAVALLGVWLGKVLRRTRPTLPRS